MPDSADYERDLLRRVMAESGEYITVTSSQGDGFLMKIDPAVWREAVDYLQQIDGSEHG